MIQIQNISYKYAGGDSLVFNNLSLSLDENRIYGLLGRNGVGKSTLLYLMAGLLRPSKGTILIDGREPRRREPALLQEICFVPDEFSFPSMTLSKYVARYAPFYPRFSHEVLEACLKDFEISMDEQLDKLSLGQKKRVMVSFALATQCRLLLMDEPTNGLDIPAKSLFRKMVARHVAEGQTILISTHQVYDVDALLDHVIVLGKVEPQEGEDNVPQYADRVLFNRSLADVTEEYAFVYRSVGEDCSDAIYSEPTPQGRALIVKNEDGQDTTVRMELLFNAIVKGFVK